MKELVNSYVLQLMPYKAGKPAEDIKRDFNLTKVVKLASNENPNPVPPAVAEAIREEIAEAGIYPDSDSYYLRHEIARYNRVAPENVIIGSGSVELVRMLIKVFLKPGQTVLTSEKTFMLYKIATIENGGKESYVEVPMDEHYRFDLEAIYRRIDEKTKIIFITNPNNPTGTMLPKKTVMDFVNRIPEDKIVVLDNAYQEYVDDLSDYADGIQTAITRKNVVVLRTFSKIYALAGLRIGYAIACEEMIDYLGRVKAPFNVTRVAQAAALASLQSDAFKIASAALNRKNREKLSGQLEQLGMKVVPSSANFIMFFPGLSVDRINERLLKEGVIIRPLQSFGVPDALRVTVGLESENDFFIEKLKKVLMEIKN